jgi:hypothetical protein
VSRFVQPPLTVKGLSSFATCRVWITCLELALEKLPTLCLCAFHYWMSLPGEQEVLVNRSKSSEVVLPRKSLGFNIIVTDSGAFGILTKLSAQIQQDQILAGDFVCGGTSEF